MNSVYKVLHVPSGRFMGQGADGYLDTEGHIWQSKRGASMAIAHVRDRCQASWRQAANVYVKDAVWVTNTDDLRIIEYQLVEVPHGR